MEHFDVVVVGAGLSGIGAGYHLKTMCPDRSYVILEGRGAIGGTWDLFRYPGVRSDSDMHTLGYRFKPWTEAKSIADGPSILAYVRETAAEHGIDQRIRYHHLVQRADWDSAEARWTLHIRTGPDDATDGDTTTQISCSYLFMCAGYYSYNGGYTADIAGIETFGGTVVHPQAWPEDLDDTGKRVVVIGSGATAMTLVPAMAATAEHVTMIQRSPTYVVSMPDEDKLANRLRKLLPERIAYDLTRRKNVAFQQFMYQRTRTAPEKVKQRLLGMVRQHLGPDYDVDTHFTPRYNPWDQRMCLVPNGDLFESIKSGRASVVTGTIETITPTGVRMTDGTEVPADIIVTATGLQMVTVGEMDITIDGEPLDFASTWTYKGFAYSGVPNMASTFGYINASWTLRADLISVYVCRLLNHMRDTGNDVATPELRPSDTAMPARPWITDFTSGYMQRTMHMFPKQGDREPWINPQNYTRDKKMFLKSPIDDGVMRFSRRRGGAQARLTASTASATSSNDA